MGLDGGGGGGGGILGVSGSFTGPSEAIELVGQHAYAYSGILTINDSETSLIEATTGNYYLVGRITFSYPEYNSDNFRYKIFLNGAQIWGMEVGGGTDANLVDPVNIVIPSYTELKITAVNVGGSNPIKQVALMAGRIYR